MIRNKLTITSEDRIVRPYSLTEEFTTAELDRISRQICDNIPAHVRSDEMNRLLMIIDKVLYS